MVYVSENEKDEFRGLYWSPPWNIELNNDWWQQKRTSFLCQIVVKKDRKKIVCRKVLLEKNCLQRCIDKKKVCRERFFIPPPSRKMMVRPLWKENEVPGTRPIMLLWSFPGGLRIRIPVRRLRPLCGLETRASWKEGEDYNLSSPTTWPALSCMIPIGNSSTPSPSPFLPMNLLLSRFDFLVGNINSR